MIAEPKKHILIVEDDRPICEDIADFLLENGYLVSKAFCGHDALSLAAAHRPALAIIDIHLPDMTGLDVAKSFCDSSAIPFLVMTGSSSDGDFVGEANEYLCFGYLLKPIRHDQLLAQIQTALPRAAELSEKNTLTAHLERSLSHSRPIERAIGLLMGLHFFSADEAQRSLRYYARSNRLKIDDVARQLLAHHDETVTQERTHIDLIHAIGSHCHKKQ